MFQAVNEVSATRLTNDDLMGKTVIPGIVSKQGARITYQLNLMFRQIGNLFDSTDPKPAGNNSADIDLNELRNRYLRTDKVADLVKYISDNLDSYILPPVSAVVRYLFSFEPYNQDEIISKMGEEYDLVKYPEKTEEVLEQFDGMLQGRLIFKESEFKVEVLDGNHRVAAITHLNALGKTFKNLRIGVQIFFEADDDRQRQAFVDMNTSTPIDKTILTLFSSRDPLSIAAKETIKHESPFFIEEFDRKSAEYIGFDQINDSITRNSQAVLSLNIVKNMLVKFALGDAGTPKRFTSMIEPGSRDYNDLMTDFTTYMKAIFKNLQPFDDIKRTGVKVIPRLREDYISLTGAGMYLIANIGYLARTQNRDMVKLTEELGKFDWRREINGTPNELFRSGILSENGSISNNRNSIASTLEVFSKKLNL